MAHARNFKELTGQKRFRLTFLEFVGRNESRNARWRVRCDCGTEFVVTASAVREGCTMSCGCIRNEKNRMRKKHKPITI